jgi:hypothetical protein
MEKNGEIKEGVTPPESHPDNDARVQGLMDKHAADSSLESHATKRAADTARDALANKQDS